MSTEKYTQKTLEAIRDAQSLAEEKGNQYLTPEHLLYALLKQDGGLIDSIFSRMGVDCGGLLAELDAQLDSLPKVSGGSGQVYASPETSKVLTVAEKTAEKLHDEYISVEHLMLGIFAEGSGTLRQLLQDHGITRSRFSEELSKVKSNPVTSDNPEDTYIFSFIDHFSSNFDLPFMMPNHRAVVSCITQKVTADANHLR